VLDGLGWAYPYRLEQCSAGRGDTVTIAVSGPVLTTEQAWRLLTSNLAAAERSRLAASGDHAITGVLLRTRGIIGSPKWA